MVVARPRTSTAQQDAATHPVGASLRGKPRGQSSDPTRAPRSYPRVQEAYIQGYPCTEGRTTRGTHQHLPCAGSTCTSLQQETGTRGTGAEQQHPSLPTRSEPGSDTPLPDSGETALLLAATGWLRGLFGGGRSASASSSAAAKCEAADNEAEECTCPPCQPRACGWERLREGEDAEDDRDEERDEVRVRHHRERAPVLEALGLGNEAGRREEDAPRDAQHRGERRKVRGGRPPRCGNLSRHAHPTACAAGREAEADAGRHGRCDLKAQLLPLSQGAAGGR
mmetsp:Transcript_40863/g.96885  ORF Transcript_40863/g.96885 Transcript_40863/m.96885 type:complete len:281 (-) Transcript_40863:682-1524(-)